MERIAALQAAATHAVYFLDDSGQLIDEPRQVAHGQPAEPPDYTPPEGRIFIAWSRDTSHVTEDVYCVALTKAGIPEQSPKDVAPQPYRIHVLDLRGTSPAGTYLPLGNWLAGEVISRDDLACLHLRNPARLNPFRLQVSCDTMLALTDTGVRAFDRRSMRPLELLELVASPAPQPPALSEAPRFYVEELGKGA